MSHPLLRVALAGALSSCFLAAQTSEAPYWNAYPLPSGFLSGQAIGSIAVLKATNAVHLYSAMRRTWTVVPTSGPGVSVSVANKFAVIQDGQTIHAYSGVRGTVATLLVSQNALLNLGSLSSTWVALVSDGATIYGFSSFHGAWVPQNLPAPTTYVGMGSYQISVADGSTAHAFSAFHGTWVSRAMRSPAVPYTSRDAFVLTQSGPDEVLAFSGYTNTWASAPFPNPSAATALLKDDYVLLTNGPDLLAFSAITGTFARRTEPVAPTVFDGPCVAVSTTAVGTACYSPSLGSWVAAPGIFAAPDIQVAQNSFGVYALLTSGATVHAFSGLLGTYLQLPASGPFTFTLGDCAAFANGGANPSFAYSAITGRWYPAASPLVLDTKPIFNGLLCGNGTGYDGFCARTGTWSSFASSTGLLVTQQAGALSGIVDQGRIDVFDSRFGFWASQPTTGVANLKVWRQVGIAVDGSDAYGYSLLTNAWEKTALSGAVVGFNANSSIGWVQTSTHWYTFAGNGTLNQFSRFPEFSRNAVRGQPFTLLQTGAPGAAVLGVFGTQPARVALPGLGTLWIDPAALVGVPLGTIPASGQLDVAFPVPGDSSVIGVTLHAQSAVVPLAGSPWLSNSISPIFF